MGLLTSALIVGGVLGGALAARSRNDEDGSTNSAGTREQTKDGRRPRPPGAEVIGTAVPRGTDVNGQRAADAVDATNPPDAIKDESDAVSMARAASTRTRRRAAAGHAGKVSTGAGGARGTSSAPRTLIGY